MDANEQRPASEPDRSHITARHPTRAEREAACRAAHPSNRQPRPVSPAPTSAAVGAHFERSAVSWMAANRHNLATWPQEPAARAAVLSAVEDLALLVGLRLRSDPHRLSADYGALVDTLAELAAQPETRRLLREEPRALLPLVAVQVTLREQGRADAGLSLAMEAALAERSVPGLAASAQDQVALVHLLGRAGMPVPSPRTAELLSTSALGDDASGLDLPADAVHTLATTILAATDLGTLEMVWPTGTTPAGIVELLGEWLVLGMADEDAVLVAEVLIALSCLGAPAAEGVADARRWLHGWAESDGRVEGPGTGDSFGADLPEWATAHHATTLLAMDSILVQVAADVPAAVAGAPALVPPIPAVPAPIVGQAVAGAAHWLDAVCPASQVPARLWNAEAWLALGEEGAARRQLDLLAEDPHLAFAVLKESGELAVHLAALVVGLGVDDPALADLCDDVAALLAHPEAAHALFGPSTQDTDPDGALSPPTLWSLRRACRDLVGGLLRLGPATSPDGQIGRAELVLLARAARAAMAEGDLGWLALILRGLHRLDGVPVRLRRDITTHLLAGQRADGAIGAPNGPTTVGDRQLRWTLQALPALIEELPAAMPD